MNPSTTASHNTGKKVSHHHHHRSPEQSASQQRATASLSSRRRMSPSSSSSSSPPPPPSSSLSSNSIAHYIPHYLSNVVVPYHGDFCYTSVFHPRLLAQLMAEGFLPIATQLNATPVNDDNTAYLLLPKLHVERCVIRLQSIQSSNNNNNNSCDLHIAKSVRKKAKRFTFTINQDFDAVIAGCRHQHGSHCWLYPPLVTAFAAMFHETNHTATSNGSTNHNHTNHHHHHHTTANVLTADGVLVACPVRLYSMEVWNADTGALAAGELGYTVNGIYTSLTGFAAQDSAGSVQLVTLGSLLRQHGFVWWDLGMEMDYKRQLGAKLMPRDEFVRQVHDMRQAARRATPSQDDDSTNTTTSARQPEEEQCDRWKLPVSSIRVNCKHILDECKTKEAGAAPSQPNVSVSDPATTATTNTITTATIPHHASPQETLNGAKRSSPSKKQRST